MYIVNEKDLKGVAEEEVEKRLAIVRYLDEWATEVFFGSRDKKTMSLAGRYIRSKILDKGKDFENLLDAVVLVDLMDFWKAVDGYGGKKDDVRLYGIFCMLFSESNEAIKAESKKVEGNIGYVPKLRFDISERTESEVVDTHKNKKGLLGFLSKPKKQVSKQTSGRTTKRGIVVEEGGLLEEEEEEIVEIEDKYVTPHNVNKLTIIAVSAIAVLAVAIVWVILF